MKIRRIKNTAEKLKNRGRARQTDNRGLTLIELVITVAIIAIFSGVVMTFIMTGSNTYRSTSSNAKVQMETQELVDRMEDLIIDTNRSLYYANGTGENTGSEIKNDIKQSGAGNSDGNKTFIVCNEYKNNDGNTSQYICDVIDWDKADATVYYSQREYTATSSSDDSGKNDTETAAFSEDEGDVSAFSLDEEDSGEQNVRNARTKVNRSVLATGILDFRADITKVESDNIVRFQLSTENGKKEIETLHSVSLRNKVKVKKPADSVDDTEPTDVGIRISYAPASMDPGTSDRLAYDLSGNGSIDPSTITWSVVSDGKNGSFPGEDHTNSKLTINENASGSITVQVSVKTSSGKWIESAPVTIQITAKATPAPTEAPEPKKLQINPVSVLVAAGSSYDLNEILSAVTLVYDDGTGKDVKGSVTWAKSGDCYGTAIQGTTLTVDEKSGEAGSGEVVLEATESETGLKAQVTVKIAKLALLEPSGVYNVGDQKPLSFEYMEGSVKTELDSAKLALVAKPQIATADPIYIPGSKFTADGVCDWTLNASYDLSDRGGFGIVSAGSSFTVNAKESENEGDIILSSDMNYDTVIAGRTYYCSVSNGAAFVFQTDRLRWDSRSTIKWYIKGGSGNVKVDSGTKGLGTQVELVIPADEKQGFTLCAEYSGPWDDGQTVHVTAERTFNVVNGITFKMTALDGMQIQDSDTLTKDQKYRATISINMYDVEGNADAIAVTPTNATNYHIRDYMNGATEATEDNLGWYYTPRTAGNLTLNVGVYRVEDRICGNDWNYGFEATLNFVVS